MQRLARPRLRILHATLHLQHHQQQAVIVNGLLPPPQVDLLLQVPHHLSCLLSLRVAVQLQGEAEHRGGGGVGGVDIDNGSQLSW